jgi:hypothetical protein
MKKIIAILTLSACALITFGFIVNNEPAEPNETIEYTSTPEKSTGHQENNEARW